MRVNSRVYDEKTDMMGNIRITNCPSEFRAVAENIMNMATKLGYSVSGYHTMTELDKNLIWDYWIEYDSLLRWLDSNEGHFFSIPITQNEFKEWFIKKATPPELIRRARQYLVERNWLIVKPEVQKHALEAGSKFSKSVKRE